MERHLRIELAGALFYVTSRGAGGENIYLNKKSYHGDDCGLL